MADDKKAENEEEVETEQTASPKKKIIIIAALVVLVLVVAGAAAFFLMGSDSEGSASDGEDEVVQLPALYMDLSPPVLATLTVDGRQRYMQISISAMGRDQSGLDAVQYHMPSIRSKLNGVFGSADFKMAQTIEGKEALRGQALTTINEVLTAEDEALIEAVYFTNFVMQ